MERKAFQTWLSAIDTLSAAQKTGLVPIAARPVRWPTARRGECSAIFADPAREPSAR